jgi:transposase
MLGQQKTSRNHFSPEKARELLEMAKNSISPDFIEDTLIFEIEVVGLNH